MLDALECGLVDPALHVQEKVAYFETREWSESCVLFKLNSRFLLTKGDEYIVMEIGIMGRRIVGFAAVLLRLNVIWKRYAYACKLAKCYLWAVRQQCPT